MACERCGSRMVARGRPGQAVLVCADCGHPADERLHGDRMRKAWFGVLALLAMAFLGGLILSLSLLHEAQRPASLGGEAAAKERSE